MSQSTEGTTEHDLTQCIPQIKELSDPSVASWVAAKEHDVDNGK